MYTHTTTLACIHVHVINHTSFLSLFYRFAWKRTTEYTPWNFSLNLRWLSGLTQPFSGRRGTLWHMPTLNGLWSCIMPSRMPTISTWSWTTCQVRVVSCSKAVALCPCLLGQYEWCPSFLCGVLAFVPYQVLEVYMFTHIHVTFMGLKL